MDMSGELTEIKWRRLGSTYFFLEKKLLRLPQMRHGPSHEPIDDNDRQHDTDPFARVAGTVPILLQYGFPVDFALRGQCALVEAVTPSVAVIGSLTEFVDHHASENVGLL